MEAETLVEVKRDGEILVLMDGRKLRVNPGDITKSALWLPTSLLEISENEAGGFYDLLVKIHGTDEQIRASWA